MKKDLSGVRELTISPPPKKKQKILVGSVQITEAVMKELMIQTPVASVLKVSEKWSS